ncbi:MAG: polyprenyl synthetase family protein [Planctomycetes bacterium]|nr:polyprenyl synthetase family protein [Planctomycetota bacterium]
MTTKIDILAGLASHFATVEDEMARALATDEPRVAELLAQLGGFHGKMLRPALVLLVAQTLGEVSGDHLRLAAALEMIHTATLIHDDMIDEGDTRRGMPTAHVRHGTAVAVLLGDYFYTHAFDLVARMDRTWVTTRLTGTTNVVCRGELQQMCARRDLDLGEDEYERIIHAKTAALCELAGELGAVAGTPAQRQAAAEYGRCCGMAFQIVDDCLDFSTDPEKVGKTLATDIERGRLTLPIIRALRRAGAGRDELGRQLLGVANSNDVALIRKRIVELGGIAEALTAARAYVARAKTSLGGLPAGDGRNRLAELADFIVSREF